MNIQKQRKNIKRKMKQEKYSLILKLQETESEKLRVKLERKLNSVSMRVLEAKKEQTKIHHKQ